MEKGYYTMTRYYRYLELCKSQSTIKMEKGYYALVLSTPFVVLTSQSTIKMEKGYYVFCVVVC